MTVILDKEQPEALIACTSCKEPLWTFKVLSKFSTRILPFDKTSRKWDEKNPLCPKCGNMFYKLNDKKPDYLMKTKTGESFYINDGIR